MLTIAPAPLEGVGGVLFSLSLSLSLSFRVMLGFVGLFWVSLGFFGFLGLPPKLPFSRCFSLKAAVRSILCFAAGHTNRSLPWKSGSAPVAAYPSIALNSRPASASPSGDMTSAKSVKTFRYVMGSHRLRTAIRRQHRQAPRKHLCSVPVLPVRPAPSCACNPRFP